MRRVSLTPHRSATECVKPNLWFATSLFFEQGVSVCYCLTFSIHPVATMAMAVNDRLASQQSELM